MAQASSFQLLAQRAVDDPHRPLLVDASTRISFTYGEFVGRARRWASALTRLGAGAPPRSRVATMLPTGAENLISQAAIAWAGAQQVPINTLLRGRPLHHVLSVSGAQVLLTTSTYLDANEAIIAEAAPRLVVVVLDDDAPHRRGEILGRKEFLDGVDAVAPLPRIAADATRAIMFTSGTSGPPKPVALSFAAMDNSARYMFPDQDREWPADGAYYSPWSAAHALGNVALPVAVLRGLRLVVRNGFQPESFWDDIGRYNCTLAVAINVATAMWERPPEIGDADNPLQMLSMTPLIADYQRFAQRFGVQVTSIYGMTEIGPALTAAHPVSCRTAGEPSAGYEVRIIDTQGRDVVPGEIGELVVRNQDRNNVMTDYDGMPEDTAKSWAHGWFRTGDRFIDDGGELCFVDRMTDSIRHHGRNVSSFDVEREGYAHPDVAGCACVGHEVGGEAPGHRYDEDIRLFVVPRTGAELAPQQVYDYLLAQLPRYMVPRYIDVVDSLPTNSSGRVVKAELRTRPIDDRTWDRHVWAADSH